MASAKSTAKTPAKGRKKFISQRKNAIDIKRSQIRMSTPLTTLSSHFISLERIKQIFDLDPRSDSSFLARFIERNKENLKFLDIKAEVSYDPCKTGIWLHTSRFAGAVPLKSPKSGLYTIDIEVRGAYSYDVSDEDFYSILSEIGSDMLPEYNENLKLVNTSVRPPIYIECEEFIRIYWKVINSHWMKFCSMTKIEDTPRGNTDWVRYSQTAYDPYRALRFNNRINVLTTDHAELHQANYVLKLAMDAIDILPSYSLVKKRSSVMIGRLRNMPITNVLEKVGNMRRTSMDSVDVRRLKEIGNRILNNASQNFCAWRLDIAELFEAYVQTAVRRIADGWNVRSNPKYSITGRQTAWTLSYLEPDIIINRKDQQIIIDAKYKSHLLNVHSNNVSQLKESFRADLHQVLAYSSLSSVGATGVALIYPVSDDLIHIYRQLVRSPFSESSRSIFIIGIPFGKNKLQVISKQLRELFHLIE